MTQVAMFPCEEVELDQLCPYYEGFFGKAKADEYFQKLLEGLKWGHRPKYVMGLQTVEMAYEAVYVGVGYNANPNKRDEPVPVGWTSELLEMRAAVAQYLSLPAGTFNQATVNLYRKIEDHVGAHNDKGTEAAWQYPIASLSFGATRRFRIYKLDGNPAGPNTSGDIVTTLLLRHGSLAVMPGGFQQKYKHQICRGLKREPDQNGPRINVTFRHIETTA
jgi:alkylated DNA repair dioxygenase AlkB